MQLLILVMATTLLITPAYGDPSHCVSSTGKSVSVHGNASVRLHPDRVSFAVGVESRAASVAEAFKANKAGVNAVLAALKQKGVTPEEIQTSRFDISTIPAAKSRPRTFRVETRVTVTRSDTSSVGELLQAAVAAGANQADSLRFSVADPSGSRKQGLELAFQDARTKAEALAALSKKTLGDVLCVSDESGYPEIEMRSRLLSRAYAGNLDVEPGSEELTFRVSVIFELK